MDEDEVFVLRIEACWDYKLINYGIGSTTNGEPVLQIYKPERLGESLITDTEEEENIEKE